jgi:hypothetical protein
MVTRRTFLIASAGIVVAHAGAADSISGQPEAPPAGTVYGRVGSAGIPSGTSFAPSRAEVTLLDGTSLQASHVGGLVRPNMSVLLSPAPQGGWSVLYAEL